MASSLAAVRAMIGEGGAWLADGVTDDAGGCVWATADACTPKRTVASSAEAASKTLIGRARRSETQHEPPIRH